MLLPAPIERRRGRWHIWCLRLVIVLIALVLPLLLLEVTLRVFGPIVPGNYSTGKYLTAHPVYGRFHVSGFSGWLRTDEFVSYLRINSEGLRGAETPARKGGETLRVLALGDSFLEAAQVRESESVAGILQASLAAAFSLPVEVVNAGVGGWGTTQEWLILREEGARYEPDLLLLFFHPANDLWDNSYSLQRPSRPREPYFRFDRENRLIEVPWELAQRPFRNELDPNDLSVQGVLRRTSWLFHVFETGVLDKVAAGAEGGRRLNAPAMVFWDPRAEERVKDTWDVTLALLRSVVDYGSQRGIPTMIVVVPSSSDVYDDDWRATQERIRQSGLQPRNYERHQLSRVLEQRAHEVPANWLDLGPILREAASSTPDRLYFRQDGHWTRAGNAVVADAVTREVLEVLARRRVAGS